VKLADTSIRRPVFAVMLVGALVVTGLVSIPRLATDLFPRVEFPMVTVTTLLEGASPETVERELTEVLEDSINTIEGIRTLRSASSESLSQIFVEFDLEYDVHQKAQEVRSKVFAARGELPPEAEPPVIDRVDPDATPVLAILISGPQSIRALTELADKRIKRRLERVSGVGNITLVGGREREIRIWIDPVKLAGWKLAIDDVLSAIRSEHLEIPGGRIETRKREFVIKTQGKLTAAGQFGDLVVAERGGRRIHLRDVAVVEDGMAEERTLARLDGRRGVALLVRRQSGENTVRMVDALREELEQIRPALPVGVELVEAQDLSRFIRTSIHDVAVDLAWGGFLAVVVVLVFLRNGRSTLIAALAIPCSLIASFAFFYFFDFTVNVLTMMALSLSIGMLIDDAIVVLENIYRHMEGGEEAVVAASRATHEIGLAVVATTLSICAVFVPIAFMSGIVGRYFHEFGLVVTCAVLSSLLVALTITPMLCSRFLRVERQPGRVWQGLERGYGSLETGYRRLLGWALRHRPGVVALAVVALAAALLLARTIPVDFVVFADRSEFNVWLKMPLGTPVAGTLERVRAAEEELRSHKHVRTMFSTVGSGTQQRVNEATLYVLTSHKSERRVSQLDIMREVRERIAKLDLGLSELSVEQVPWVNMPGVRGYEFVMSLRGPEIEPLARYSHALAEHMRRAGGYKDVSSSYESGKPQIELRIDRERAAEVGIPAAQVGRTVLALFSDYEVASFEDGGERYDVRTRVLPEFRDDPLALRLVNVRAPSGSLVNLSYLVVPRLVEGPVQIDRENRARSVMMFANLEGKAMGPAVEEMKQFGKELGIGGAYEMVPVGRTEHMQENLEAMVFAFGLGLIAIYMVLASQFNSFVHPFTIMLSAPLSFIGAFAALGLLGYHLDMMGQIGFLMLMGLVMKNGILLVDYTNTLRERGLALRDAVIEAGPIRLRPVLMTTAAMIFGMMPVAFGRGDGAEWRNPMGVIAIGGLLTSTLLTLVVVPVVYTLLDDAQTSAARLLRRTARSRPEGSVRPLPDLPRAAGSPSDGDAEPRGGFRPREREARHGR
jgi:HAE1 family hydrophobic/amphiphilic exporter-1